MPPAFGTARRQPQEETERDSCGVALVLGDDAQRVHRRVRPEGGTRYLHWPFWAVLDVEEWLVAVERQGPVAELGCSRGCPTKPDSLIDEWLNSRATGSNRHAEYSEGAPALLSATAPRT